MTRLPTTPDCAIKGCKRASYKAGMCAAHYALVPLDMALRCAGAAMDASMREAAKHHRKMRAEVRRRLAVGDTAPEPKRSYMAYAEAAFDAPAKGLSYVVASVSPSGGE